MAVLALNTHAFVKRLKAANMTEEQAEAIVDGINSAREADIATLATKADLAALKADLAALAAATKTDLAALAAAAKADLKQEAAALDAKIDKVELRLSGEITLLKWMVGLVIAGILALILKAYFPH